MADFNEPLSRNEAILQNILGASNELLPPQSRVEAILQAILYNTAYTNEPQSVIEELLLAIKNSGEFDKETQSRNEKILLAKLHGEQYTDEPQSRIEELLIQWLDIFVTKTVSGSLVTLTDAIENENFVSVEAEINVANGATSVKVYRIGTNFLKSKNGVYQMTGRAVTVENGEMVCEVTGGSSSAVIIPSVAFDSAYYIPAGKYYFSLGLVFQQNIKITTPIIRFVGINGTTYDFSEGAFTLPVAARIEGLRHSTVIGWAIGDKYIICPKITLANGESFVPWKGNEFPLSWASEAGSITSGKINLTTGVLTSGGNTYQLTPTEIAAIVGTNNIWADTGDITITYKAQE